MQELVQILESKFNRESWTLTRPAQGHQKDCYIALSGDVKVFIKLGIDNPEIVAQLSDLAVAPALLGSGQLKGQPYLLQEFIEGTNPAPAWFGGHLAYLAAFIRRYHTDETLARLLSPRRTIAEPVAGEMANLETRFTRIQEAGRFDLSEFRADFAKLKQDSLGLQEAAPVPVHAEPNTSNMLLEGDRLNFIDWDEIRLGDPLQDIGQILWWYVPPAQWPEFFEAYGTALDEEVLKWIYWWAAKASLSIALWQYEHGFDGRDFLRDFQAAVRGRPNPRAAY